MNILKLYFTYDIIVFVFTWNGVQLLMCPNDILEVAEI